MFFKEERENFFKPLTSKYREQIVQCLCLLYQRQYSSSADYGQSLNRVQVIEIFEETLARYPELSFNHENEEQEIRFKTHREHASFILKQLLEHGWLEKQVDSANFQSTFPFSRMGRIFSQVLVDSDNRQIKTRHRNTRNTLNALEAFSTRGEVYDLLDAFEYSERIIADFSDVISELEERKRALVKEVEAQQLVQDATDQFFDFMEKRFQPDIQVRLSADSVEKHREDIHKTIQKIRRKRKEFKANAERELRRAVPDLQSENQSFLYFILDQIELRMRNATEIMLPALRRALHGFTRRADIIIRQLSYINTHQQNDLLEICAELSDLSEDVFQKRMQEASETMATVKLQLIDPEQIKLIQRKTRQMVDSSVRETVVLNKEVQRENYIQEILDQAFTINNSDVKEYVYQALRNGKKISTRELPTHNAKQLLNMAYAIEAGAINNIHSDLIFKVTPTGNKVTNNEYYKVFDEFTIELVEDTRNQTL